MSLAILFVSANLIFSIIYHLWQARKNEKLRSNEFRSRLGALTQDQRETSLPGVFWKPVVLLRWTATMLIMTLLRYNFYVQIFMLLAISTVFQLMIVGSKPMSSKLDNNMLLFNEIMVSLYLYLLLCLTDFMIEHDKRDLIAWVLLFLVVFTVLFNLVKFLIFFDWCYLIRKFKKKCIKHKKHAMDTKKTNVDELKK
jgi:Na+/phosphate symporter